MKDIEVKHVLKQALTDVVSDRLVSMKSIDHSYYSERYNIFKQANYNKVICIIETNID